MKYLFLISMFFTQLLSAQKPDFKNTQLTVDFIKELKDDISKRQLNVEKILRIELVKDFENVDALFKDKIRLENIVLNKKDIDQSLKRALLNLSWVNMELRVIEEKAKIQWDKENQEVLKPLLPVDGEIYNLHISANRLGVIYEKNSRLKGLENDVKRIFKSSIIRSNGMTFMRDIGKTNKYMKAGQNEWFFAKDDIEGLNPFRKELHINQFPNNPYIFSYLQFLEMDTLSTFKALINIYEVDAILWNTTFGNIDKVCFNELVRLILKKKVKLYVLTDEDILVPKDFLKLVKVSKGSLVRVKN